MVPLTSTNGRERLVPGVAMVPLTSHAWAPRGSRRTGARWGRRPRGRPRRCRRFPRRRGPPPASGPARSRTAPRRPRAPPGAQVRRLRRAGRRRRARGDVNKGCDESGPSRPSLTVVGSASSDSWPEHLARCLGQVALAGGQGDRAFAAQVTDGHPAALYLRERAVAAVRGDPDGAAHGGGGVAAAGAEAAPALARRRRIVRRESWAAPARVPDRRARQRLKLDPSAAARSAPWRFACATAAPGTVRR